MARRDIDVNANVNTSGTKRAAAEIKTVNNAVDESTLAANKAKRAQEGVAKGSLSASKAFSKQQQGLGGLVRSYATIAANVFALTQVFQILRNAADFYSMQLAAEDMAKTTGVNMMRLAKEVQAATGHNLALKDSLEAVNKTLAAGANPTQAKELASLAAKISQTFGGSVEANMNKINSAVLRGRTELLATLGVVIDTQQVYRDYASQLGKTVIELTSYEKKQATINAIQEEGKNILGDINLDRNPYLALLTTLTDVSDQLLQVANKFGSFFVEIINESEKFAAALIVTLGAVFAKKLTPDAATYASKAKESLKGVQVALLRQGRTETGLAIKAGDLQKRRTRTAKAQVKIRLTEQLKALAKTQSAEKKFSNSTISLFERVEKEGIMAFKDLTTGARKELAVLQAQITKTINYKNALAKGETVKPLRGVSSGISKGNLKELIKTRDLIDQRINKDRKLGREVKKLTVNTNSLGLALRNLNAQRKVAIATGKRMAAQQKILVLRLVEQRGVIASIIPSFIAVERRLRRIKVEAGLAGLAFKGLSRVMGYAATATTLFTAAVNKIFPVLTGLWLAWEIGTAIYKKFFGTQDETLKQLEEAKERYSEFKDVLDESVKSLSNLQDLTASGKSQSTIGKFLVNYTNTLTGALSTLINPLIFKPIIEIEIDKEKAEKDIEDLRKELDTLEMRKLEISLDRGLYDEFSTVELTGENFEVDNLQSLKDEIQEKIADLELKIKIKADYSELIEGEPILAGFAATLQTLQQVSAATTISGFTFDTSGIEEGLKGASDQIKSIVQLAVEGKLSFTDMAKEILALGEEGNTKGIKVFLKNLQDGIRLGEIRLQSLSGSMATINEQFIRAAGAAAKTREQLTNLTVNPELARATSILIKDFENLNSNLEGNEDGLARFINIDILEKTDDQLKAIFKLTSDQLRDLINDAGSTEEAFDKLLTILKLRQSNLFATAEAKILEQQAKLSKQVADNYKKEADILPDIESALIKLGQAETKLKLSAHQRLESRRQSVIAAKEERDLVKQNQPLDEYSNKLAQQKVDEAEQAVKNAYLEYRLAKRLQLVDKERFKYLTKINSITKSTLTAELRTATIYAKNTTLLAKQAKFSRQAFAIQDQLLDAELDRLNIEKKKFDTLKELERYRNEEYQSLLAQEDLIKARREELQLRVALEAQILDIRERGNRYNPLPGDVKQFGKDLHTILKIEAYNFSKGMKTAAEEWAAVILKTTDTAVDSLVDDIIEGGVDIAEAIKASIRTSIGDLVKENIKGTLRNILGGVFPDSKAGKKKTQEEALKRLEDELISSGADIIKEAKAAKEAQAKAAGKTDKEIKAAGEEGARLATEQLEMLRTAEGRDIDKTKNIQTIVEFKQPLTDIKNYLTIDQKESLRKLLECCKSCSCGSSGMSFNSSDITSMLPDTNISDVVLDTPPDTPPASPNGPTAADNAPSTPDITISTPPPAEANDGIVRSNDRRNVLLEESNEIARVTQSAIIKNQGQENVDTHNRVYNETTDPDREPNEDKDFWFAFNSILKTFFGPLGSLFSIFGTGGGGFDFSSFLPGMADGGIIENGVRQMQTGGIVNSPQFVEIGEGKNAEAVVPLPNNREIPVRLENESKPVVFNQNFDFRNADPATETRLRQQMEEIKRATLNAVSSELNRGGSLSKRTGRR